MRYDFSGSTGTSGGSCSCGGWVLGGSEFDRVAPGGAETPGLDLGFIEKHFTSLSAYVSVRFASSFLPRKPLTED